MGLAVLPWGFVGVPFVIGSRGCALEGPIIRDEPGRKRNTLKQSVIERNDGPGAEVNGNANQVALLQLHSNGEAGLEIHGTAHTVTPNIASANTGSGLQMLGTTASRFDRNRGENNRGVGITDNSTGGGTGPPGAAGGAPGGRDGQYLHPEHLRPRQRRRRLDTRGALPLTE